VGVLITLRACTMHARHAHRKSSTTGAEHAWTHSFWGEIDFVKAAAAAHAAGSPISALMLLEFAAEAEGELVPATILGNPPFCRQYAVVCADLPAPDCARNVPSGGSLSAGGALSGGGDGAGTLRVLALRGDHVSALGLLDAAQQQAHLDALAAAHAAARAHTNAPTSQSQWPATESARHSARRAARCASSMPSLVLRSARALHTLGCHALCAATLRAAAVDGLFGGDGKGAASGTRDASSLHVDSSASFRAVAGSGGGGGGGPAGWVFQDGAVEGELRELRAECAWRLSAWDGAWDAHHDASAAGGADGEAEWSLAALAPRSAGEGVVGDGGVVGVVVGVGFHERLRSALHSMDLGQVAAAHVQLQACLLETARRLGATGEEGGKQSLTHILAIRMAADAKEVAAALEAGGSAAAASAAVRVALAHAEPAARARYERQLLAAAGGDFEVIEPLLALHSVLLRRYAAVEPLALHLVHSASAARQCGAPSIAGALLAEAAALPNLCPSLATCTQWQYAQLLWQQGQQGAQPEARSMALAAATSLADRAASLIGGGGGTNGGIGSGGGGGTVVALLHERIALAQACRCAAEWGVVEGLHDPATTTRLYEDALAACGGEATAGGGGAATAATAEERCHVHAAYAAWLDAEHRAAAQRHAESPDELRAASLYELAKDELRAAHEQAEAAERHGAAAAAPAMSRRASRGGTPAPATEADAEALAALRRRIALLRTHVEGYEQAAARRRTAQLKLAAAALRQHAACARCGDEHDHASLFGVVGLWLEYQGAMRTAHVELRSLPAHKLLPLILQLACQLGPANGEGDGGHGSGASSGSLSGSGAAAAAAAEAEAEGRRAFQAALRELLLHVAQAHLHVVLPHLLALAHADRFAPGELETPVDRGRLDAAKQLVQQLRELEEQPQPARSGGGSIVQATQLLWDFYLQLAWVSTKTTQTFVDAHKSKEATHPKLSSLVDVARERKSTSAAPIAYQMRKGADLFKMVQEGHARLAAVPTAGSEPVVYFGRFGPHNLALAARAKPASGAAAGEKRDRTSRAAPEPEFTVAGGINLPKILWCYAEDGTLHKQLLKGRDDLRGDALMQQAFGVLNLLLGRDAATRQRALRMRTYRVVPLSPTAGVLQWVDDTMPLALFLVPAHERYRPNDMKHNAARVCMAEAHKQVADAAAKGGPSVECRLNAYQHVAERLRPVFHHFFLERYLAPALWFSRRLAYASSVAAGSMVGYVLGLGDRHSSNILIDKGSAELVHIDLGIAFDAGRLLKTPECVPFRLTRDLEDGLGVSGVEGMLRGAAEHTMRVLRANAGALVTILEVFVRNPLYKWQADPTALARDPTAADAAKAAEAAHVAALAAEAAGSSCGNREAERALLRIQDKLAGRVAGHSDALAVEGQVRALLDEARDPENLCRMYDGWAAWL
jgi:ataxia telangiectasia mutated family protein